jgi:hypothetical protein
MRRGLKRSLRDPTRLPPKLVLAIGCMLWLLALASQAYAASITNSADDLRTGWYPNNALLTPQLVSGGSFGKLWSASLEGQITAQPLLANGTLLVATEKDKTYGLDAATGAVKWSKSLGTPWNPADLGCGDITPSIGTVATPVIDPETNIAYLTHKTYASGSSGPARWYMDALDVGTGAEQPGFPVEIAGSAQNQPGVTFDPTVEMNRPGLLLMGGVAYAAFGSHCDLGEWHGWIFGVSTAGKVKARYVDSTDVGAGIWQSGAGLTSDGAGTIMFSTGNGGSPTAPTSGSNPPANLGESVVRVRVQPDGSLKAVDFFTPFEAAHLDENDADFASGGVTGLPGEYFGTSAFPHLAVAVGKSGYVYLLNRDNLGGFAQGSGGSDNVIQRLGPRGGVWSRPGVWPGDGGYLFIPTSSGSSAGGKLDVYKYGLSGSGSPSLSLAGSSEDPFGWGSGAPVITSDGTKSGSALVWVVWSANRQGEGGQLRAYDPVPVSGHPVLRFQESIGTSTNYSVPGIDDGRVYVGNREGKVFAFGSPVKAPLAGPSTSFPTTTLGHSSEQTVTLTANEPLTVTALTSSSSQFVLGTPTPALPVTLEAGQHIVVPVTFTPLKAQLVAASLTAETSIGSSSFALTGTGQAAEAELEAAPKIVSFPGIAVGSEKSESVTFTNVGGTALTINGLELPTSPFSATGLPSAGSSLAPGASVTVTVSFAPSAEGSYASNVGLVTTAGEKHVGLAGTAGAPARLHVSEEALHYGAVTVATKLTKSFTITNEGGVDAVITKSKPPIGGAFTADTALQEGATIHAGESITEQVSFIPTAPGMSSGTWLINADDTTGLHQLQFDGVGVAPLPPSLLAKGPGSQLSFLAHPATKAPVPDAELASDHLKANSHGLLRVLISCPASETRCLGTFILRTRPGRTPAGGRASRSARSIVLATGAFSVLGGHVGRVQLHLNKKARALLARLGRLKLMLLITAHDPAGARHTARPYLTLRRLT